MRRWAVFDVLDHRVVDGQRDSAGAALFLFLVAIATTAAVDTAGAAHDYRMHHEQVLLEIQLAIFVEVHHLPQGWGKGGTGGKVQGA